MSEQSPQNDNTAVSAAAELGAKLREAREKRGFSIGEVAERLKLPARQIEGLESGNYENMPGIGVCARLFAHIRPLLRLG